MTTSSASSRRRFLQAVSGTFVGISLTETASAQEYTPAVTFNDQTSPGDEVTVAEIVTNEPVYWKVHAEETDYAQGHLDGKQRLENETIELENEIEISTKLYFSIYPEGGGYSLAYDDAWITVENDSILGVNEIEKNTEAGFNYPYFLYVPPSVAEAEERVPLFVQTSNSPRSSEDFSYHKRKARDQIGGFPRTIADELAIPALVPVIPRPRDKSEFEGRPWFQGLDVHSLQVSDHPAERIDLQVLRMVDDARQRLREESYQTSESVLMNGFSSSAEFANRFSILHPERVLSVSAGGLTGMVVLPREEAKGHTLPYHIGIANMEELVGKPFNKTAFSDVAHYYYMGSDDTEDNFPYETLWPDDLEAIARDVYGERIIADRFPYCAKIYQEEGVDASFEIYDGVGHRMGPARDDLIEFHREALAQRENRDSDADETETVGEPTTTAKANDATPATKADTTNGTAGDSATASVDLPTTRSEASGLTLLSGLTSVIGATYVGSRLLKSLE